jgi:hypothetical protein
VSNFVNFVHLDMRTLLRHQAVWNFCINGISLYNNLSIRFAYTMLRYCESKEKKLLQRLSICHSNFHELYVSVLRKCCLVFLHKSIVFQLQKKARLKQYQSLKIGPPSDKPRKSHFYTIQTRTTAFTSCRLRSKSKVNSISTSL